MAKKKSATKTAKKPASSDKPKKVAPKKSASKEFSYEEIGRTAGDVWAVLTKKDGQTLAALKKSVDAPADLVVAAVGWLAREEKLDIATSGRSVKVSLR